jgi:hypothetical protein
MTATETSVPKRHRRPRPAVRKPIGERHVARLHLQCTSCGRPTRSYDISLAGSIVFIECLCGLRSEISWQG